MKHGSLFSGIGGFDLAAEWAGYENIFHCEWNPFGQRVLKHYWPNAISYDDITKTDFTIHRGKIDLLSGGFPCQPYSNAGKRKGKEDERHLWPEMLRAIWEIHPRFIVGENVSGLVNWNGGMVFDEVQDELEAEGYQVTPFLLPAASVNAPHKRERVWFIAYADHARADLGVRSKPERETENKRREEHSQSESGQSGSDGISSDTDSLGHRGRSDQSYTDQSEKWEMDQYQKGNGNRIWSKAERCGRTSSDTDSDSERSSGASGSLKKSRRENNDEQGEWGGKTELYSGSPQFLQSAPDTDSQRQSGQEHRKKESGWTPKEIIPDDWKNFPTQSPICDGDDGLSSRLDRITFPKWRNESIKGGGNAIVPQVAYQIFKAINQFNDQNYGH
jgi:DNA (cytosine-5)-methyltransferase 1